MTYNDIENTFIVGNAVLVAPVLDFLEKDNIYEAYFPAGNWTDLDDFSTIEVIPVIDPSHMKQKLTAKDTTVKKFLMQGSIIPVQMEGDINST
jgi:alpha-glucosidase (family GH31 glycosyl hydrolase)